MASGISWWLKVHMLIAHAHTFAAAGCNRQPLFFFCFYCPVSSLNDRLCFLFRPQVTMMATCLKALAWSFLLRDHDGMGHVNGGDRSSSHSRDSAGERCLRWLRTVRTLLSIRHGCELAPFQDCSLASRYPPRMINEPFVALLSWITIHKTCLF